ncbi:hypothetical protein LTR20_007069 [Exophiala xenobiotica]|nr:hypothetical protein LTS13_003348 [Exophiala xenobiotica]KAK5393158.1 hypothetical protein LTR79_009472 [Exophiala xenobiotica]KAK5412072.1 hypothetical protein LTR90_007634 [Exophiala xenobiotica]KAK5447470.1 hypothetical protein LTR18_003050 [Exophiala xenobiotica]KAK5460643.1 hypothetical protein LTR20_007069 [Exophiala xenobiotica]
MMQTSFQQGYITDLVCPPPPPGKTASDVLQTGLALALDMVQSAKIMCTLNPFVQDVTSMPADHPKLVDVQALAATFGVQDYAATNTTNNATSAGTGAGAGWAQYEITDKLPVFAGYSTTLVYHTALRQTRDGLESLTNPGNGVTIHGRWVIKVADDRRGDDETRESTEQEKERNKAAPPEESEDGKFSLGNASGVINLLETQRTRCNVVLSWYIKQSFDKSHRTTHRRFKELWRERMKMVLYPANANAG